MSMVDFVSKVSVTPQSNQTALCFHRENWWSMFVIFLFNVHTTEQLQPHMRDTDH